MPRPSPPLLVALALALTVATACSKTREDAATTSEVRPMASAKRQRAGGAGGAQKPAPLPRATSADEAIASAEGPTLRAPPAPLRTPRLGRGAPTPSRLSLKTPGSRSVGTPQTGHLEGGVPLTDAVGPHLRIVAATRRRGYVHGTRELITLLRDVAMAVGRSFPGSRLAVANLSRPGGGDIPQSVSHNSGRDADIAFFLTDREGRPVEAPGLVRCDDSGVATGAAGSRGLRFDTARNWAVIRHLLSHPAVVVQWIFVAAPLRNMLLDHALRTGAPPLIRERARRVLVQPSDSSRHDDHFHVRVACPADDTPACRSGPGRTAGARAAQIDALLTMYRHGTPAERRYAREILSLPVDGSDLSLPPAESDP